MANIARFTTVLIPKKFLETLFLEFLSVREILVEIHFVCALYVTPINYKHQEWQGGGSMKMTATENSQSSSFSSNALNYQFKDPDKHLSSHGDEAKNRETTDEVREILEVIATTGKFWHDWYSLKSVLSFQLKQVLSEYPEAKMANDQQSSLLGETHAELVKRLDGALHRFIEGPPFTLQRLCEILLAAWSIYPNLSKLALALEKNLSVTSTLSRATDPCPSMKQMLSEPANGNQDPQGLSNPIQNGVEGMAGDGDEEMVEAEAGEVEEGNKDINMETTSKITDGTQETRSDGSTNFELSTDSSPSIEQRNSVGS
ncbi:serine/threonine-protein phosphatase 4 regulatory subunit 2-like [Telopea speciosissima]|uniref:serine/threonine-protein phosphatase 4 regulatory subunit 2-like n=1 Tax=Telopea speciosissima TaxID=54955 RepID=UPI001CC412A9|nr:serine/threonine-protein phosphatase 4 regulatory subunit 2-like [Telopea speciosissima]